mmetsp:Transcript_21552/g.41104  ORF Transcript_21552/g.41104 Transcript_21552/m.41104 type:complete len:210 (-) Transcript_21552:82-711(-)
MELPFANISGPWRKYAHAISLNSSAPRYSRDSKTSRASSTFPKRPSALSSRQDILPSSPVSYPMARKNTFRYHSTSGSSSRPFTSNSWPSSSKSTSARSSPTVSSSPKSMLRPPRLNEPPLFFLLVLGLPLDRDPPPPPPRPLPPMGAPPGCVTSNACSLPSNDSFTANSTTSAWVKPSSVPPNTTLDTWTKNSSPLSVLIKPKPLSAL